MKKKQEIKSKISNHNNNKKKKIFKNKEAYKVNKVNNNQLLKFRHNNSN